MGARADPRSSPSRLAHLWHSASGVPAPTPARPSGCMAGEAPPPPVEEKPSKYTCFPSTLAHKKQKKM